MPTKIEWSEYTGKPPRWSSTRSAPECDDCYDAVFASYTLCRVYSKTAVGSETTGRVARGSPSLWHAPRRWCTGPRVFTCSVSDSGMSGLEWLDVALNGDQGNDGARLEPNSRSFARATGSASHVGRLFLEEQTELAEVAD
jgi:hypothetical protein